MKKSETDPGLDTAKRIYLSNCAEFQAILTNDPVIEQYSNASTNQSDEFISIMEMLGSPLTIAGLPIQPITPAVWAFLYGIENKFVGNRKEITPADADQFFYILRHGLRGLDFDLPSFVVQTTDYIAKNNLRYEDIASELLELIRLSFRPLSYIPAVSSSDNTEPNIFNADWLATITSIAARMAGISYREVMFNMPLSTCFFFYIENLRELGNKGIGPKSDGECIKVIYERTEELGKEYIKNHPDWEKK